MLLTLKNDFEVKSKMDVNYLIIGNGKMAKHFCCYLEYLKIPYLHWYRNLSKEKLAEYQNQSTHILFLISDSSIDQFIEDNCLSHKKDKQTFVHFSGALISKYAYTAHPLQSFAKDLYSAEEYLDIYFGIENEGPEFNLLLPKLSNRYFKINRKDKPYYHALGSIANNFTTLLWQKYFDTLEERFNLPSQVAIPLFEQTLKNIKSDYANALTGPIARNDLKTIDMHFKTLKAENDSFLKIYQAFVETFLQDTSNLIKGD